ncbi:MAG TPA: flavodoxin family protein [Candidatus Lokiarchaeia archaeon]|nr:flavodoxin family protein [Candidatus Lokiarchaeia archaeon]
MKVLGISGSPRDGATEHAVRLALQYIEEKFGAETRFQSVHDKKINFCTHCDYCVNEKKGCKIKDGMEQIYADLKWADAIIMGTPVYNGTISGQLKTIIDRTRALVASNPKILQGKHGVALAVGGDRNGGQELACLTIITFFMINGIMPVSGGAFGGNLGIMFWSRDQDQAGIDADDEGLVTLKKALKKLYKLAD